MVRSTFMTRALRGYLAPLEVCFRQDAAKPCHRHRILSRVIFSQYCREILCFLLIRLLPMVISRKAISLSSCPGSSKPTNSMAGMKQHPGRRTVPDMYITDIAAPLLRPLDLNAAHGTAHIAVPDPHVADTA